MEIDEYYKPKLFIKISLDYTCTCVARASKRKGVSFSAKPKTKHIPPFFASEASKNII
jgi:hypothetical protein